MMRLRAAGQQECRRAAPEESPTRIRSALARARAEPRLIAIDTPAPPEHRRIVDAVAHHGDEVAARRSSARTRSSLSAGDWRAANVVDAALSREPRDRRARIAALDLRARPLRAQLGDRAARSPARGVSCKVEGGEVAPVGEPRTIDASSSGGVRGQAAAATKARRADPIAPAVDACPRCRAPGTMRTSLGTRARGAMRGEGAGDRMLGRQLQCRRDPQALMLDEASKGVHAVMPMTGRR